MIISSRSLFNLLLPYECMHIVLSFNGVILQSGSGVFSQRVYIAHDWLSWFHSRHSRIPLLHKLELSTLYFLAREMSSDEWGWAEYHIIWGLREGRGAREDISLDSCGSVSSHHFSPHAGILLVSIKIISQTPGSYYIKRWWTATLVKKKNENLLLFKFPTTVVKYGPNFGRGDPGELLARVKHPLGWSCSLPASLVLLKFCLGHHAPTKPTMGSGLPYRHRFPTDWC